MKLEPMDFLRELQGREFPLVVTGQSAVACVEMLHTVGFLKAVVISSDPGFAEARVHQITELGRLALAKR
ncbi:hypothetical protein J2W34_004264 [Variovorax boronicumulans]|uniref:hypothetical protein n=1 Tax=Variovorax TaxID=34072 RepID=UPI0027812C62|nr:MULTISPECIES: hypothetical protein [Variovorax]MDQ0072459.1 hypothetical protein [Variovorax boronicumulans]MDQ0608274.1 hypothetical protein [Variovorax sp. W1I1]